jgi:hypothetical protein
MSVASEAELMHQLVAARGDELTQLLASIVSEEDAQVRKAVWAFRTVSERGAMPQIPPDVFRAGHVAALREHALQAAAATSGDIPAIPPLTARMLVFAWHFPEYPRYAAAALDAGAVLCIAQESPWQRGGGTGGRIVNFRAPGGLRALIRAMQDGLPLLAMFDHCYPETRSIVAPFLGFDAYVPVGLLELAARYGYEYTLATYDGGVRGADTFTPTGDVRADAERLNRGIEREIAASPSRWVLWAAVAQRWVSPPY